MKYISKIKTLIIGLIMLSLSACHNKDPLESYNRSMYHFNTTAKPYIITPFITTYTLTTPPAMTPMLLNSQMFVKHTFNTPYYLIKRTSPLQLWNRFLIDLLLGGCGSTSPSDNIMEPLPMTTDHSWPIVLPLIGPMGMLPLTGAILGSKMLAVIIPSNGLRVWSILSGIAKMSNEASRDSYIALSSDPYATHIKLMHQSKTNVTGAMTYALPEF